MKHPHHATVARAQKLGFTIETGEDEYTVRWPEYNRTVDGTDVKLAVENMATLKMLTLEYPGVVVEQHGETFYVMQGGDPLGESESLAEAWADAQEQDAFDPDAAQEAPDEPELEPELEPAEDDEPDEDSGKSVVKKTYKRKYRPHKNKNGDEIGRLVSEHVQADEKGDDGRARIDPDRLREFAIANGCWQPNYAMLNVGMQRMNVCNRLRARIKKGNEPVWG